MTRYALMVASGCVIIVLFSGWTALAPAGRAAGDVNWTLQTTFESFYPDGFIFRADIQSSAGPVERARVVWSHTPGTQRSRPAEFDLATGQWYVRWKPVAGDAIPPWLSVSYHWEASDTAGNTYQSEGFDEEYTDASREWLRVESEDVIVFSLDLPAEAGEQTLVAMAAQREVFQAGWGDLLPYRPRAILLGNRSAWREWQIGPIDPTAIGTTRADWGATVQVVSGGSLRDLAFGTVLHEVAHLYQMEYAGTLPINWFSEGNATFFELSHLYDYEAVVRRLAALNRLPVLLQGTGPGLGMREGYDIGSTFFEWLVDVFGWDAHRRLMVLLGDGVGRNEALEAVTGLTVVEIESQWRVWLGAPAQVPTLVPTPTPLFFPSPTPFVPGA